MFAPLAARCGAETHHPEPQGSGSVTSVMSSSSLSLLRPRPLSSDFHDELVLVLRQVVGERSRAQHSWWHPVLL